MQMTWPEAIIETNKKGTPIMSNRRANQMLLESEEWKQYKPRFPLFVGKMEIQEARKKPFGKRVITECKYSGKQKQFIYDVDSKYQGEKNLGLLIDQIIKNGVSPTQEGASSIQLLRKSGDKLTVINSHEELIETDEVFVKLSGNVYTFKIEDPREEGMAFGFDGSYKTKIFVGNDANISLVIRDCYNKMIGLPGTLWSHQLSTASNASIGFGVFIDVEDVKSEATNQPTDKSEQPKIVIANMQEMKELAGEARAGLKVIEELIKFQIPALQAASNIAVDPIRKLIAKFEALPKE
jgi:hypothetical protein